MRNNEQMNARKCAGIFVSNKVGPDFEVLVYGDITLETVTEAVARAAMRLNLQLNDLEPNIMKPRIVKQVQEDYRGRKPSPKLLDIPDVKPSSYTTNPSRRGV